MAYEHIKELLGRSAENQADLARLLGRTPAVITNLFDGTRSLQIEEVEKLAAHFRVSTDYILYGVDKPRNDLADAEIALTDALKTVLQVLLHHGLATPESLGAAFNFQTAHYREKGLPNAITVMDELRAYVTGAPRASEKQVLHRILQLPPPKPLEKPPGGE